MLMPRALAALPCLLLPLVACTDDPTPLARVEMLSDRAAASDAALSPDGAVAFFAGQDGTTAVVGRLDADGAPVELLRGGLLRSARGLVALDATTVYVADEVGAAVVKVGAGAPVTVAATMGTRPRAVELDGAGALYWVGVDGDDPAVFALTGEARRVIARDGRFTALAGLDVAADGTVYVTDEAGAVFRIADGVVTVLADDVSLGTPAGVALTPDDATVMVSSLDASHHSQVLLLDAATGARSTFNDTIGANTGSGGLHRAQAAGDRFIWCGVTATGPVVYRVTLD